MLAHIKPFREVILASVLAGAISASVYFYYAKRKKHGDSVPTEWKKIGVAEELFIFPLKSGHYIKIDSAECTEFGFRLIKSPTNCLELRDRSFMVYGEEDLEIRSGRSIPSLVKIEVSIHDENCIILDSPQMSSLYVRIPKKEQNKTIIVKMLWTGESMEAIDCGDEAARWISQYISKKDSGYRLGFHDATKQRVVNCLPLLGLTNYYKYLTDDALGLFSDLTSLMIINKASVSDYLQKVSGTSVTMLNFRANIVINGPDIKPYEEDNWLWMKIGDDVIIRNVKDCTRCIFTNVDAETGVRNADKEPLKTLSNYRMSKGPEKSPVMGNHMEVKKTGIVKCGDPVYIGCV